MEVPNRIKRPLRDLGNGIASYAKALWRIFGRSKTNTADFIGIVIKAMVDFHTNSHACKKCSICKCCNTNKTNTQNNNGYTDAAALSFWLVLSLAPLVSLIFKGISVLLQSLDYGEWTKAALMDVIPFIPKNFIDSAMVHSQGVGNQVFSWVVLLFGSYLGFKELSPMLSNRLDQDSGHRSGNGFIQWIISHVKRLTALSISLLFMVLILALITYGIAHGVLKSSQFFIWPLLTTIIGIVVATIVIQHMPSNQKNVSWRHALIGAVFFVSLWFLAKSVFVAYLTHQMTWGIMYGPLMSFVVGLSFLYYTSALLLLSAGITAGLHNFPGGWPRPRSHQAKKKIRNIEIGH